jgi:hypothetical protein
MADPNTELVFVDQTILHNPPEDYGNCYNACLATIVGCTIEETPQFIHKDGKSTLDGVHWWTGTQRWLRKLGFNSSHEHDPPDVPCIAQGGSPRGNASGHCVVWDKGQMVHDPHPSRDGLTDIESWIVITKET